MFGLDKEDLKELAAAFVNLVEIVGVYEQRYTGDTKLFPQDYVPHDFNQYNHNPELKIRKLREVPKRR